MLRILIHVPGDFNDGMDSNCRGEGRWSLNFGHMMALEGHDVIFMGNPGRGSVLGCRVVPLGHPLTWEAFDVFFDTTYWRVRGEDIDAKTHIHAYWAFDEVAARVREDYGEGHYAAIATHQQWEYVPNEAKEFTKLFPFPVARQFHWGESNFDSLGLYWNVKYGFEDSWDVKRSIVTHAMLHTAVDLAEEFSIPLHILHAEHVFGGGGQGTAWSQELQRYVNVGIRVNMKPDLFDRLKNHHLVRAKGECAWIDAMEILRNCRLMLANFDPPVSPMPIEAVSYGTIPMQTKTNIFQYGGPWIFEHIADELYYRTYVKDVLRTLLTDRKEYDGLLKVLRDLGLSYTYAKSYEICSQSVEEMLKD